MIPFSVEAMVMCLNLVAAGEWVALLLQSRNAVRSVISIWMISLFAFLAAVQFVHWIRLP